MDAFVNPALRRPGPGRRIGGAALAALLVTSGLLATAPSAGARPGARPAATPRPVPSVLGFPPVASTTEAVPAALPAKGGTVKLDRTRHVRPARTVTPGPSPRAASPGASPQAAPGASPQAAPGASPQAARGASPGAASPGASAQVTASAASVALRALVVSVDDADFGVATWRATLDRVGAAYDVLHTRTTNLTSAALTRPDGTGRYNAILLTNSMMLHQDGSGAWVSALTADEWNLLWAYERDYGVRQATLYSSYGTWPEDYCLRPRSEGGVGDNALTTTLTPTGAAVLDHLNPAARIPILQSYVYRTQLQPGCGGQAVLTAGTDVLGVLSTSPDGRERLALSFTSNQHLLQANLLTYGLFRWASQGLHFGEQRHYLTIDVDDWFNSTDELLPDGTINSDPGFRMSGHDAYNAHQRQAALRNRHPLAAGFRMDLAFNGGDADLTGGSQCWPNGGVSRLTATSRCLRDEFRWMNHTLTHPKMNFTDYATSLTEIAQNLAIGSQLGFAVDRTVLKTGEYSGLGVYHPDVNNDIDPPTDHGLQASNPELLRAAKDQGVKYLHGNMSFASHQPPCFNCAVPHPLEPSLTIVPDWPTNIAYFSTTPAQETYFYNSFYGPNGKFPFWPTNLTYNQIIEVETDQALNRVATGSVYTNTLHIGNLRDYGGGRTLTTDWADRLMAKYSSLYAVPLLNPGWPTLARYASSRNGHFDTLGAGVDAVHNRAANTVTVTSPASGSLTVSGASVAGSVRYGSEVSAPLTLTANVPVSFTPALLP